MVKKKRKVIWDEEAWNYFKEAIAYIKKDSVLKKSRKTFYSLPLAESPERVHALINTALITTDPIGLMSCTNIDCHILSPMNIYAL
jgi:hypothetical protein